MIARTALVTLFLLIFCGCHEQLHSSLEEERQSVQKGWAGMAKLVRTGDVKQSRSEAESSWEYEFNGDCKAAIHAFAESKPSGYEMIYRDDSQLRFARFDGHDSYQLAVTFDAQASHNSTTVLVVLHGLPG